MPVGERELDANLTRAVKRAAIMRQGFYLVVLVVAAAGQVSGLMESFNLPMTLAIPAVAALELGGVVVMANADVRRRLGERAVASRVLSAAIAGGAVAFNWLAHADHLLGGFFAGMSALGYLVWLMHTENSRRDRLRAKGALPPTTPAYELVGHWLRHPWLTRRARALARQQPNLGLYGSLAAARAEIRREKQESAISKVLHRKIRSTVDPATADIAVAVYDLDEIAKRLADGADYDGLTALIAADLTPSRLAPDSLGTVDAKPEKLAVTATVEQPKQPMQAKEAIETWPPAPALTAPTTRATPTAPSTVEETVDAETVDAGAQHAKPVVAKPIRAAEEPVDAEEVPDPEPARVLPASVYRDLHHLMTPPGGMPKVEVAEAIEPVSPAEVKSSVAARPAPATKPVGAKVPPQPRTRVVPLRKRVHEALDAIPGSHDTADSVLLELVMDRLRLNEVDRIPAQSYLQSWRQDVTSGKRAPATT